jgi:hypothetical protein
MVASVAENPILKELLGHCHEANAVPVEDFDD